MLNAKTIQTMGKGELMKAVTHKLEMPEAVVRSVVEALLETIEHAVVGGHKVSLKGFGGFSAVHTPARNCVNPKTGERLVAPPAKRVRFKAAPAWHAAANQK